MTSNAHDATLKLVYANECPINGFSNSISMSEQPPSSKDDFLFPRSKYWGDFTPQNLAFNANLQEFAQRVSFVCNLETGGKISALEAYDEIKSLWKHLKRSKANLLDTPPPDLPPEDGSDGG